MSKENVHDFIKELKEAGVGLLTEIAKRFNEEKYELIMKIKKSEPLEPKDWALMNEKYLYDYDFARIVLKSPIKSVIKDKIIENFFNEKIVGMENDNATFIHLILENHKQISDYNLESLFYMYHRETMQPLRFTSSTTSQEIPQTTIDRLIILEADVMNGKAIAPMDYKPYINCFSYLQNNATYDYVINNMPVDGETCEKVSTSIINAKGLNDKNKNLAFNLYGCSAEDLIMSTPEISNALYLSAVESAFVKGTPAMANEWKSITASNALLDHMVRYGLLTESAECDFVNRLIDEDKTDKNRGANGTLTLISEKTTSPKVLHIIFTSATHINNRDEACKNPHISEEDIKEQARLYCEKIDKKLKVGNTRDILEKWVLKVNSMATKATLDDKSYETLLQLGMTSSFINLVATNYTPQHIFEKAEEIIDEKIATTDTQKWQQIKLRACMNKVIKEYGFNDNESLDVACKLISGFAVYYDSRGNINNPHTNQSQELIYIPMLGILDEAMQKAIQMANYKPKIGTIDNFKQEVTKAIAKINREINGEDFETPITTMNEYEIKRQMSDIMHQLSDEAFRNDGDIYTKLETVADRYVTLKGLLSEKESQRSLQEYTELYNR